MDMKDQMDHIKLKVLPTSFTYIEPANLMFFIELDHQNPHVSCLLQLRNKALSLKENES